jgi:hypothetical protein
MSQLSRGIFGAIAVSLSFGAALAAGRDLARTHDVAGTTEATINRAAKADRADGAMVVSATATKTISLRLDALSDTSVVIRMPAVKDISKPSDHQARSGSSAPSVKLPDRRAMVACEPPVSVLTEVAKQLQPGRCVT